MKKIFHNFFCFLYSAEIRTPFFLVLAFLIFLPFAPSSGKVFLNRLLVKGSPKFGSSKFDTTGSWRRIYQAPLAINGARASLSIYGCDEPLELVKMRLKQSFGLSMENSFWISAVSSNQLTRMLALEMPGLGKSLVFTMDRSPAEFSKPAAIPSEGIFTAYTLLPESRVETIIKNEETGAMLETRIADAAPDIIIGDISAKLSRHGWKQVHPGAMAERVADPDENCGRSKQRFLIFQRGDAVCTLLAGPVLRPDKTCVTILLKEKNGQ